jgi:excisionase family DNA binding protein
MNGSPKIQYFGGRVTTRASGVGREKPPRGALASHLTRFTRTTVGGNELNAVRRASATYRGALTLNHEPTMSAFCEQSSKDSEYLTIKEVAAHFRVCRRTIEREIAAGRFPRPLAIGRSLRFTQEDLRGYVAKLKGATATPFQP